VLWFIITAGLVVVVLLLLLLHTKQERLARALTLTRALFVTCRLCSHRPAAAWYFSCRSCVLVLTLVLT
jgi:hypothetical protein